jgi:kumamolisin
MSPSRKNHGAGPDAGAPAGYTRLSGSERRPSPTASLIGRANPSENVKVSIALRRRRDGQPVPDFEYFRSTPAYRRPRLSEADFAARYGADPADIERVVSFAHAHGLAVPNTHAGQRTVVVTGTVAQMEEAFAVQLGNYEHMVARARGREPERQSYRGRDGFIYVPQELEDIIVGVFGLDNRNITKRAGNADPPNTTTVTVPQMAGLYDFPTNSAAGQNIAVFSEGGYDPSDLQDYYNALPASYRAQYSMANVTPVAVDATNGSPDVETSQDISIAFSAAPGADIYVYFTTFDQVGWYDLIHRVVHPQPGDATCSVLTTSFYVSNGDDPALLLAEGITMSWVDAVHSALEDAAIQGVTFCVCSGDYGVDMSAYGGNTSDGKQHVTYPASDPYALACGGTTVGNINGTSFDEYVWNDTADINGFTFDGASGGGVSNLFALPSYQQNAGVPVGLNGGQTGRGVPDVAFNASWNSGYYPVYCSEAAAFGYPNPYNGNGTSASAPMCAGLIAVINAALGYNVGFLNPLLYELGTTVCRDVNPYATNPPSGPVNNSPANGDNVPGYPAGPGWDACTGWGSIEGTALLTALQQGAAKDCYLVLDWQTFVKQGVSEMLAQSAPASYPSAFFVVAEGFTATDLEIGTAHPVQPTIAFSPAQPSGLTVQLAGPAAADPSDPLRFTFAYNLAFSDVSGFPSGPDQLKTVTITASVTGQVTDDTATASAPIELSTQSGPFMVPGPVSWLSNDIRVFQLEPGGSPTWLQDLNNGLQNLNTFFTPASLDDTGSPTNDATSFIQQVITGFNQLAATELPPNHPFDALATSETGSALDLAQTDTSTSNPVYNFAVARVRYQDAVADAENVRVFFRTFPALAVSTAYDQTTTYRRWSDGVEFGDTISLLGGQFDPSLGQQLETVPFFAEARVNAAQVSMDTQLDAPNVQTLAHDPGDAVVYAYYGCWLDINQPEQDRYPQQPTTDGPFSGPLVPVLQLLANQHQCVTAEVAFDPIPIAPGATPGTSPMLGQRNLTLGSVPSGVSGAAARLVGNPFELRSTSALAAGSRPDELMIDWGPVPAGSVASLYLPEVDAGDVVLEAIGLYGRSKLALVDPHTLRFPADGVTYIPLPAMAGTSLAGLLSVQLPPNTGARRPITAVVRQVTTVTSDKQRDGATTEVPLPNWRRVVGAFQLNISVLENDAILGPEERLLSLLRWIGQNIPAQSRWAPVFARYLRLTANRVQALGGNPAEVVASPTGNWQKTAPHGPGRQHSHHRQEHTGKVTALRYDRFGDFDGFLLETFVGHEAGFDSTSQEIEALVDRAWSDHILITVVTEAEHPRRPAAILYRR